MKATSGRASGVHPDGHAHAPGAGGGERDVVVVGAGHAGLATAVAVRERGLDVVVLERTDHVAASWRARHDSLRLNTEAWGSGLPGMPLRSSAGLWPTRDEYVRYLEEYAARHDVPVSFGMRLTRVERRPGGGLTLRVKGQPGGTLSAVQARSVVVATGPDRRPRLPDLPALYSFPGEALHAVDYRNAAPFAGRRVLVVGGGESGADIAVDLAREDAAAVWLAVRTAPYIMSPKLPALSPQRLAVLARGQPGWLFDLNARLMYRLLVGDLSAYGLARPPSLHQSARVRGKAPILDRGFTDAVKAGRVVVTAAAAAFEGPAVVLADGRRLEPDVVVFATGYHPGLEPLVGHLGVLRPDGHPQVAAPGTHPLAPEVYLLGFRPVFTGNLREAGRLARRTARAIARQRRHRPARRTV